MHSGVLLRWAQYYLNEGYAMLPIVTGDKARLTFDHVISDRIQDMVDVSFKFYKLLNDDQDFAKFVHEVMFKEYVKMQQGQGATG